MVNALLPSVMTRNAQRLPIVAIPKQPPITAMRDYVIYNPGRLDASAFLTMDAKRISC
jgi:hypothetical protein